MPLDPGYPDDRLAFMVKNAGVELLLGSQQYEAKLTAIGARTARNSTRAIGMVEHRWGVRYTGSIPNPSQTRQPRPVGVRDLHFRFDRNTQRSVGYSSEPVQLVEAQTGFFRITRESRVAQVQLA